MSKSNCRKIVSQVEQFGQTTRLAALVSLSIVMNINLGPARLLSDENEASLTFGSRSFKPISQQCKVTRSAFSLELYR